MSLFLVLTFLFFAGSLIGWGLEVFWRRFFSKENREHKWINPGFLTGPYLPIYGLSLTVLFLLSFIDVSFICDRDWLQKIFLFIVMALCITLMEFLGGLIFIKGMHIKLWDYSKEWGNVKGLICPLYTFFWMILSGIYYFLIHPKILEWLYWFTNHLAFSFVIGFFYGVFTIDMCYTFNISAKIRNFANEQKIEVRYEKLKALIQQKNEEFAEKRHFIFAFKSYRKNLHEILHEIFDKVEKK